MEVLNEADELSSDEQGLWVREHLADDVELLEEAPRILAADEPSRFLENPGHQPVKVGDVLGEFELREEIGRGGMGIVFRAHQPSLEREVAVKVLASASWTLEESILTRFRRESKALARLSHPGIVQVFAQGEVRGHHYFAMELIDGVDSPSM